MPNQPDLEQAETLDSDGPSLGNFTNLTLHKDGLFSTIYKARLKTSGDSGILSTPLVALKVTRPSLVSPPHSPIREARLLSLCGPHDNIIPLLSTFSSPSETGGNLFILVLPFLPYDLDTLLRHDILPVSLVPHILSSLFQALSHIHSYSIIHRDVKPSNILLSGPLSSVNSAACSIRLIDFGIAYLSPDQPSSIASAAVSSSSATPRIPPSSPPSAKTTDVGTTHYRPPELLFGDRSYGTALDLWAAGCVATECVRRSHRTLFSAGPVGSELGLIKSIFETIGTPDTDVWPVSSMLLSSKSLMLLSVPSQEKSDEERSGADEKRKW